jgi:hypothetical protein
MNGRRGITQFVIAFAVFAAARPSAGAFEGSLAADSLVLPNEAFILTRDDLAEYNINTLHDILEILPGVSSWFAGDPAADAGFSIDGRSSRGATLLINGEPFHDPYSYESLHRFLPLSRLQRVEVVFSGSPMFSGDLSSNGFINLVIEEGGREGPLSIADFTYGRSNRRARRLWFATPEWDVSGALAYDEYLQDAVESYIAVPTKKLGLYDMRSVLSQIAIATGEDQELFVQLHRYEDTYLGTASSSIEDVRHDGFDSKIRYRRSGLSLSLGQRGLEVSRRSGRIEGLLLSGDGRLALSLGGLSVRAFASAERAVFENRLWGVSFDPRFHRVEGGVTAGMRSASGVIWRAGVYGGGHSEIGGYMCGEAGLARASAEGFSSSILVSRRLRLPSARELFQPELASTPEGVALATSGSIDLGPEVSNEITAGLGYSGVLFLDLFYRREKSRIILKGSNPSIYRAEGTGEVLGTRGRCKRAGSVLGFGYGISLDVEIFGKRSSRTPGVPEFRVLGGASLRRRIFKDSETLALRWDSETTGERAWEGARLGSYSVHDVSVSLSVMDALIKFQWKNVFNVEYETVPGYRMPGRYYQIGIIWKFFD